MPLIERIINTKIKIEKKSKEFSILYYHDVTNQDFYSGFITKKDPEFLTKFYISHTVEILDRFAVGKVWIFYIGYGDPNHSEWGL